METALHYKYWQIEIGEKRITHDGVETIVTHMRGEVNHNSPTVAKRAATMLAHKHETLGPTVKYETLTPINRWRDRGDLTHSEHARIFLIHGQYSTYPTNHYFIRIWATRATL